MKRKDNHLPNTAQPIRRTEFLVVTDKVQPPKFFILLTGSNVTYGWKKIFRRIDAARKENPSSESVQNLLSCYIYGCWRSKSIWSKSIYFFKTTSFYHLYEVGWYCISTMSWNSTFYSCSTTKFVLCGINMLNTSPKCNVLGGTAVL